jgi:hypothetical protein
MTAMRTSRLTVMFQFGINPHAPVIFALRSDSQPLY